MFVKALLGERRPSGLFVSNLRTYNEWGSGKGVAVNIKAVRNQVSWKQILQTATLGAR